jgi:hypothetical protein
MSLLCSAVKFENSFRRVWKRTEMLAWFDFLRGRRPPGAPGSAILSDRRCFGAITANSAVCTIFIKAAGKAVSLVQNSIFAGLKIYFGGELF